MSLLQAIRPYAKECPYKKLHCEGEPCDNEHYGEEIKMKQPDVGPPSEPGPPLEVTAADEESPLLILYRRLFVADDIEEDNDNQAPIFQTRFNCKGRGCTVIIDGGSAMNVISKEAVDT